jgi:hypothetical protein
LFAVLLSLPLLFLLSCGDAGLGTGVIAPPSVFVEKTVNVSTPTWTWHSDTADSFRYLLDSVSGDWTETQDLSYTPACALADGTHTLYVKGKAKDGTWTASGSASVEIDTVLSFVDYYDRINDGYYITSAIGVAASSDGKTVLVAGQGDKSLVVFDCDNAVAVF